MERPDVPWSETKPVVGRSPWVFIAASLLARGSAGVLERAVARGSVSCMCRPDAASACLLRQLMLRDCNTPRLITPVGYQRKLLPCYEMALSAGGYVTCAPVTWLCWNSPS